MKLVIQRVREAHVTVEGETIARIGRGAMVLVAAARGDTEQDLQFLARKTSQLRFFDDDEGKLNRDIAAVGGAFLVVSQFTLYGDCRKGNRPSFMDAAPPEEGREICERFIAELRALGQPVQSGQFQTAMQVHLVNDGPVTLILESCGRTTA